MKQNINTIYINYKNEIDRLKKRKEILEKDRDKNSKKLIELKSKMLKVQLKYLKKLTGQDIKKIKKKVDDNIDKT